jgi:hypothetical protein
MRKVVGLISVSLVAVLLWGADTASARCLGGKLRRLPGQQMLLRAIHADVLRAGGRGGSSRCNDPDTLGRGAQGPSA